MSMLSFARHIAAQFNHKAAYIDEQSHGDLIAGLRDLASVDLEKAKSFNDARRLDLLASYGFEPAESSKPFAYSNGIAIIPIHGLLINRMSWSYSFATGYNFIRSQMNAALNDPDVTLIVYDINTSGGMAAGCRELSDEMFAAREVKPSLSVIDARCYSAGYFLGSSANRVVVTQSGGVGSIGVVAMHIDYSAMLEAEGLKITFIKAGDEKVDGNPYEALSKRARDSIQQDVDYHYGLFTGAVARNRDLPEDDVRATQARCFLPPEALELGLVDAIESPADAVANFFNELTTDADDGGEEDMATQQTNIPATAAMPAPASAAQPGLTMADVERLVAEGIAKSKADDKARSASIRTCDEAKERQKLAAHIIENTSMSVDEARALLLASPVEAPEAANTRPAANNGFAAAMDKTPNPNVGADAENTTGNGGQQQPAPAETANRLLGNYNRATGAKVRVAA